MSTGLDDDSTTIEPESTSTSSSSETTSALLPCVDEDIGMMVGDDIVMASTVDAVDDFKLGECFGPGPSTTTGVEDTGNDVSTSVGGTTGVGEFWGDDYVVQWTPPETFVFTISITGSDFDNIVGVYPPACGSEMESCNDDCYGVDAGLQFVATEGEPVFIVIDGRNGQVGTFSMSITQGAGVCE